MKENYNLGGIASRMTSIQGLKMVAAKRFSPHEIAYRNYNSYKMYDGQEKFGEKCLICMLASGIERKEWGTSALLMEYL